jgi:hypothetical protein
VDEKISYAQWGVDFFAEAISEARVVSAVNTIAGHHIDIGPVGVGPGGFAKMTARGTVEPATAELVPGDCVAFRALVPVDLTFEVDLRVEKERYEAQLLVPLTLTAVARTGLRIFIEAAPPEPHEVQVNLQAQGSRASLLQRVAGVEDELRRFVAEYVAGELERPEVRQTRSIHVARAIPDVWATMSPEPDGRSDLRSGPRSAARADSGTAPSAD